MDQRVTKRQFLKMLAAGSSLAGLAWLSRIVQIAQADGTYMASLPIMFSDSGSPTPVVGPYNPAAPAQPQRLIFIHHSTGQNWLADDNGQLGLAAKANNYFMSDTNYGWGPGKPGSGNTIGDNTDIGNWWDWFLSSSRDTYLNALYAETDQHSSYSRLSNNPGGENTIIMFKSCFPNSSISGNPGDAPTTGSNALRGQSADSSAMTVANVKGIYADLLNYFSTRQDKLFVAITAPPLVQGATDASAAANARAVNLWLVNHWLDNYTHQNVAVFDFYNGLTSNSGNPNVNDAGKSTGNHHRYRSSVIEYITNQGRNFSQYGSSSGDSHPTKEGGQKASMEFLPLLNIFYHRWKNV